MAGKFRIHYRKTLLTGRFQNVPDSLMGELAMPIKRMQSGLATFESGTEESIGAELIETGGAFPSVQPIRTFESNYRLYYDPELDDPGWVGCEANWRGILERDGRHLIVPAGVIANMSAETRVEIGMIVMGKFMQLMHALNGVRASNNQPVLSASVNLAPEFLIIDDCHTRLIELVKNAGMNPEHVLLELLESVNLRADRSGILERIKDLQLKGFKLSIDDLGLDFSKDNLLFLIENGVEIEEVKFDGTYTISIQNENIRQRVQQLLELAKRAKAKKVVFEGLARGVTGKEVGHLRGFFRRLTDADHWGGRVFFEGGIV
ncbi:EAL domain-containing protein [Candidatus Gracilibacteria bacterium]|nr:EAL domain-containing protein [Candidatus Gracilibacteria bacterium]